MTLVEGSRHYPGFIVRADTPERVRASPSFAVSVTNYQIEEDPRSAASTVLTFASASSFSPAAGGIIDDQDEEDDDKENAIVRKSSSSSLSKGKRKKSSLSTVDGSPRKNGVLSARLEDVQEEEAEDGLEAKDQFSTPKAKRIRTSASTLTSHRHLPSPSTRLPISSSTPLSTNRNSATVPSTAPPACAALRLLQTPGSPPPVPTPHPHTNLKAKMRAAAAGKKHVRSKSGIQLVGLSFERPQVVEGRTLLEMEVNDC